MAHSRGKKGGQVGTDLRPVNEAPTHPMTPNPHTLPSQVPEDASWFAVLGLEVAFLCIKIPGFFLSLQILRARVLN